MNVTAHLLKALHMTFVMFWDIFWGLCLGFLFSAIIEQLVSKARISELLPDAGIRSIAVASGLGAASSSCSYAAVAMARSMVRKGANFTAAMAFQFAATNLVVELGVLLVVLLGWQFGAAEFIGGPVMIVLLVLLYRVALRPSAEKKARAQAMRNTSGAMEGHAQMSMSDLPGRWQDRLLSSKGWIAISHGFVMNWTMLWKDILGGLLIAGVLSAWVPQGLWQSVFQAGDPTKAAIWGAFLGPLIAMASFTCSVGNIPFASVLWQGGISFGGVIAFIFGDLIIPPLLNIYRKYYGGKMALFLMFTFYLVMVGAALVVEFIFAQLHLLPARTPHALAKQSVRLNYTTVLDVLFGVLALILVIVFVRTGGPKMLRDMAGNAYDHEISHG